MPSSETSGSRGEVTVTADASENGHGICLRVLPAGRPRAASPDAPRLPISKPDKTSSATLHNGG